MIENGKYQRELVERLSFLRYGGTPDEEKAGAILAAEIEKFGGTWEKMPFTIPAYEIEDCSVAVTAPYCKDIPVVPYGSCGCVDAENLNFLYLDSGSEEDWHNVGDVSNTVVMINELNFDAYKLICDHKPAAFMVISGKYYDTEDTTDVYTRRIRETLLPCGQVPGFMIRARDALDLVANEAQKLNVKLVQRDYETTSHNIVSVIKGTGHEEDEIVLTAHYDSVLVGTGSWDNATGSASLMYIYQHFMQNPPLRTMHFVWCGSEEQGLYGSKAYAKDEERSKNIKFCFNFDMGGTYLGCNTITVTGGQDLIHMAEQISKEAGYKATVNQRVHSSDSAPFADKGVPSIGIGRRDTTSEIHTRHDLLPPVSAKQLSILATFAIQFISRIANAAFMPIPQGMPDDMIQALDKYFYRDKLKTLANPEEALKKSVEYPILINKAD